MSFSARVLLVSIVVALSGCGAIAYKYARDPDFVVLDKSITPNASFDIVLNPLPLSSYELILTTKKQKWYGPGGYIAIVSERFKKNFTHNKLAANVIDLSDPDRGISYQLTSVKKPTLVLTPSKVVTRTRRSDGIAISYYSIEYSVEAFYPGKASPSAKFRALLGQPSVYDKEYVADTFIIPLMNTLKDAGLIVLSGSNAELAPD